MALWRGGLSLLVMSHLLAQTTPALKSLRAIRTLQSPVLDGKLDEAIWSQAPVADGFTQEFPLRGVPAKQRTEVRVLYDDRYVYVGARMHHDAALDGGKATIVKRLHRRDQDSQGDWFGVAIDSLRDRRTAFLFEVNAAGVQKDQVVFGDNNFDASWDGVWESSVSVDDAGWTAELKIPLSLLRINAKAGTQTWGINFNRFDQGRLREFTRWNVTPRGENGFVSRFPELTGIEGIQPQPRRELIPYVSLLRKFETAQSFDDRRWEVRGGLDAHWSVTSHSQLDLSVRPDFGQVEVDQAVINLSTVETFFPEKRPFFLEGAEIFKVQGPDLFYSRRIGRGLSDPDLNAGETLVDRPNATEITAAAKYTAKYDGNLNVGLLGASVDTARAKVRDAAGQASKRELYPLTNFGVLRVQKQFGARGSYLGGFASTMHQSSSDGRVAQVEAVDGLYKSRDQSTTTDFTLSRSQAGIKDQEIQGWRFRVNLQQNWSNGAFAFINPVNAGRDYDPNDVGFLPRADEQRVGFGGGRHWDRTAGIFRNWEWNAKYTTARDQAGHVWQREFESFAKTDFTNFWSLSGMFGIDLPVEDDRELRTFRDPVKKYLQRARTPYASLGFDTAGNKPWYVRANVDRAWHEGGPSTDWSVYQNFKLNSAAEIQTQSNWTRDQGELRWLETQGSMPIVGLRKLSQFNQTLRLSYAFNPRFTVQLFSQWLLVNWNFRDLKAYVSDQTLSSNVVASGGTAFSARVWNVNLITRWEFKPGSAFFLVYTHGANTDELINNRASISPYRDLNRLRHEPSDDAVQIKISYLFR
jgi:Domain of unknown function (DUF5916)/Carbohydrate family 9 binding domain-like